MFNGDSGYQTIINHIYKIHGSFFEGKVSIPRLAIIGDQSGGKSSTLEAMTQLPFPHGEGMCTRFPIQVNLRRNSALKEDLLSARIEGEDDFNKVYMNGTSRESFRTVIDAATRVLCNDRTHISNKVLDITLTGPKESPLTVIDLPGFINQSLDKYPETLPKTIHDINTHYIQDSRTIILAVIPASNDIENSTVLTVAKGYDPAGERTIPIVTKPDLMNNAQQWISVIRNKSKFMKRGYLVMCNKTYQEDKSWEYSRKKELEFFKSDKWSKVDPDRMGRVAVKAFLGNLLYEHITKELPAFKREVRVELDNLRIKLQGLGSPIDNTDDARTKLRHANLKLQRQVVRFLDADYDPKYLVACRLKMESPLLKQEEGGDGEDKEESEEASDDEETEEESECDVNVQGDENPYFVRSSLLKLYHNYRSTMRDDLKRVSYEKTEQQVALYKDLDLPGFVSFKTFKNVFNGHYLPGWRTVTDRHIDRVHRHLTDALRGFIKHAADEATGRVFTRIFSRFSRNQEVKIKQTVEDIFEDEEFPFTLDRAYVEAVHKERSRNNKVPPLPLEQSVTERNQGILPKPPHFGAPLPPVVTAASPVLPQPSQFGSHGLSHHLKDSETAYSLQRPQVNSDWNDMLTTKAMVPCLLAYLTTALERIVDKVLMETIERHMIRRIDVYFDMMCEVNDEDLDLMLEPPMLKEQRRDYEAKIADLESLLDEI
ncbi:hypothetical protein BGW38_010650 [Lunasporangiospora selenospora]|uniref:Dynamin-type G domain-containing protein n=1 Tax=Lunasporangiospora selenospora TaxID=979761 RepID=A0A9P6FW76_9FUNG|nr:hypothetical protein BGW38_010650 [Lunasporangiospora selenospora]